MASLERTLRKDLERAVKKARNVAEAGARQAIAQLGVGEAEAPKHLAAEQRALRNGLRAHGRQLGDRRDPKTGAQVTARLAQECAYEHWHRMLFARFLAETDLLIEPDSGVAITLDEVQELAREKGIDWLPLASDYAERMLPQIFRKDDPVLDIALPPETRSALEDLLKALPKAVFEADDSLGWVYQFWQAEKKDEVNKSEVKIGADELPAVTQLFTEDYMVLFLLHNTLGAWWAGKVLAGNPALTGSASSEDALRAACRVGDVDWTYLRFVRDNAEDGAEGPWRPAAGTFDGWPKAAKDITVLDPCMGSGHFLVFALPILVAFRMAEEGLSERDAIDAALRDNLFGLEIDPRCTQIAAFNLAFAAWKRTEFHALPQLNLACSGLAIGVTKTEWLKLAEKAVTVADPAAKRDLLGVEENLLTHGLEERVKNGLEALYDLFAKAPWLGSLIDPRRAGGDIFREGFEKLEPLLGSILPVADTDDTREMAVAAQGMAKAAQILGSKFTLTATNVPYLGRGKQDAIIRSYCEDKHPSAKSDVATCFIERCANFVATGGGVSIVTPQNWLFLNTYKKFRATLLKNVRLNVIARIGEHGFESPQAAGAFVALINFISMPPSDTSSFCGLDASDGNTSESKLIVLQTGLPTTLLQRAQVANPDHRIAIDQVTEGARLSNYCSSFLGLGTGDYAHYGRCFWEFPTEQAGWAFQQATVVTTRPWGGREHVLAWDFDINRVRGMTQAERDQIHNQDQSGQQAWGRKGVAVGLMRDLKVTIYTGERHEKALAAIIPQSEELMPALWTLCKSREFHDLVRELDHNVIVANGT
ncbi:MAG: SAM-dependent methyltransferase, partial [Parvibaculaceae bacterium]